MKSIFDEEAYAGVLDRLEKLTPDTQGRWGKMDVAQMLAHCQNPLEVALGRQALKRPNAVMRVLLKRFKASMYNDKPWKHGMATAPQYRIEPARDFKQEKSKLLELIKAFHNKKNSTSWKPHPAFGAFTHEQWGQMQYKHLDHHLAQFGV